MKKHDDVEAAKTDLELNEFISLHKLGWVVQTAGLFFIFSIVLATGIGLFGNGPVSKTTIHQKNVEITTERFFRQDAVMPLTITLYKTGSDATTIGFTNEYLHAFQIQAIVPEPEKSVSADGNVYYSFTAKEKLMVTFFMQPNCIGKVEGNLYVSDQVIGLKHFIFP